jgi:DNA-binding transcriptional LysR family regulator
MELRHLRYFLTVAEEGHFGRAAERLHIVQPALSMQVRALETELGTALFERTSRRVVLTEAGVLFRVEAERTVQQAARAKDVAQRAARGEVGTVRIGFVAPATFAGKLAADVSSFKLAYPEVDIELTELSLCPRLKLSCRDVWMSATPPPSSMRRNRSSRSTASPRGLGSSPCGPAIPWRGERRSRQRRFMARPSSSMRPMPPTMAM